jgi:D-alanyl-D-alanine carboxypeptidase/D-alanyl-D-alanine-endopeptidase (penicillin-binding protein 4)
MVRSDNLMAEGALRAIAPGATRSDAIARMREVWLSRGIDIGPTRIFDGSGLARGNALSPHMLAQVLTWMAHSDCAADYLALFPRPGQGTLRTFLADQSQRSRFALKTGSMGGVQCYAGYHLDEDDNPTHVVVIMVNNFTEKRADLRRSIEDLLTATFPQ